MKIRVVFRPRPRPRKSSTRTTTIPRCSRKLKARRPLRADTACLLPRACGAAGTPLPYPFSHFPFGISVERWTLGVGRWTLDVDSQWRRLLYTIVSFSGFTGMPPQGTDLPSASSNSTIPATSSRPRRNSCWKNCSAAADAHCFICASASFSACSAAGSSGKHSCSEWRIIWSTLVSLSCVSLPISRSRTRAPPIIPMT